VHYSVVILTRDGVYAARDPWGFRPLSVGLLPSGGYTAASVKPVHCRTLGCRAIREVNPGEVVSLRNGALVVTQALQPAINRWHACLRDDLFLSPGCGLGRVQRAQVRQNLGRELVREKHIEADVSFPVPDSSVPAAIVMPLMIWHPYNDWFLSKIRLCRAKRYIELKPNGTSPA